MALIELRDIWKIYDQGEMHVVALRDANLEVESGEFVALTGPSGSGKSTLFRIAAGLVEPDRGTRFVQPGAVVRCPPPSPPAMSEHGAVSHDVHTAARGNGDASGLSQLAYDPSGSASQMTLTLPAANARALLNGLPISSETNTLSSAIDGLNITLLKASSPPATANISVSQDRDAIKKAISDFTTAYNAINQLLRTQTKFDASNLTSDTSADAQKQAQLQRLSSLQGDSTALGILNQLRGIVGGSTMNSSPRKP